MNSPEIGKQIRILANLLKREVEKPQDARHGLTVVQSHVIGFLYDNRDRDVFQRDVENEFSIRCSTATEILKLMQRDGLITKEFVDYDDRLKKLILTPKAIEIHEDIHRQIECVEEKLRAGFSEEELEFLYGALDRLKENLLASV